jgi:hypothetical protein
MKAINTVEPCNSRCSVGRGTFAGICRTAGIVLLVWLVSAGCSALKPIERESSEGGQSFLQRRTSPVYHDFEDILIPGELRLSRTMSSVFQSKTIAAGVLVFSGKMDRQQLVQFFKSNMVKDNWTWVSGFTGSSSLLLFEKENRWCVITLTGAGYGDQTRVWVSPKTDM